MKVKIFASACLVLFCTAVVSFSVRAQAKPVAMPLVTQPNVPDTNAIYTHVDQSPCFPGGEEALQNFLWKDIKKPLPGMGARVYITFVVERDGRLTDFYIMRAPTKEIGEHVKRVMKLSPKWIPGKQNGVIVRVSYMVDMNSY